MFGLFAQAQGNPFDRPEIIWGIVALAAALLVGGAVVYAVDRWRKRSPNAGAAVDELNEYRQLFDRGEITEAEYARLRLQVAERVKQKPAAAADPSAGDVPLVDGLPRVTPGAPPPPKPAPPEAKPWETPRRESDPPA